jgi:hypothetical protein
MTESLEERIRFEVYDGEVKMDSITPTFNITGMTLDSMNLTLNYEDPSLIKTGYYLYAYFNFSSFERVWVDDAPF